MDFMFRIKVTLTAVALGLSISASQATVIDLFSPWVPDNAGNWSKEVATGIWAKIATTGGPAPSPASVANGSSDPLTLTGVVNTSPYVLFSLSLYSDAGLSTPTSLTDITITGYDIDSQPGRDMSDVFGFKNTSTPDSVTLGADLEAGTTNGSVSGYTVYQMKSSLWGTAGSNVVVSDILTSPGNVNQAPVAASLTFSTFSTGDFYWGFTGTDSGAAMDRGLLLAGTTIDVPEPGSATASALAGAGLFGLVTRRRRRA
jgi:hypothetical protein